MTGVHDMGGVHGFGPISPEPNEPTFHQRWEAEVLAVTLAMGARGLWNLDESRQARESLPRQTYLNAGYYRIWLEALEALLEQYGVVNAEELQRFIDHGEQSDSDAVSCPKPVLTEDKVTAALAAGSPVERPATANPVFAVGDQVIAARPSSSEGHTRLPRYVQGCQGEILRCHGCHVFADSHAAKLGEKPQWLYSIRFSSKELWGNNSTARWVHLDCWESYLRPVEPLAGQPIEED